MKALVGLALRLARLIYGWANLIPATATFTTTNMLIDEGNPITAQFLQRLAENTGYNYTQNLEHWNQKGWAWKNLIPAGGECKFAETYDFDQKYFIFWDEVSEEPVIRYLTVAYQSFITNFDIKSLAAGGFQIQNTSGGNISVRFAWMRIPAYGEGTSI